MTNVMQDVISHGCINDKRDAKVMFPRRINDKRDAGCDFSRLYK